MPVSSLRNQITETQKIRSDLLKWKLVLVSGIGAVGLGIQEGAGHNEILLGLIPLVCVYVDALCAHLSLRIRAIGVFMAIHPTDIPDEKYAQSYERFIRRWTPEKRLEILATGGKGASETKEEIMRQRAESRLESIALRWSTVLLSALALGYGILMMCRGTHPAGLAGGLTPFVLMASGVIGMIISKLIGCFHDARGSVIRYEAAKHLKLLRGRQSHCAQGDRNGETETSD